MSYRTAAIYQALSRVCADVTTIKVVMGVNLGTAQSPIVRPIADELPDLPAIFLVPGPWSIIAGSHRRDTINVQGSIFGPREDPGESAVVLMDIHDALCDAFQARAKAYDMVTELQSVLVTEGPGLETAEWPVESNVWYLTWPFELEVKVNTAAGYQAQ